MERTNYNTPVDILNKTYFNYEMIDIEDWCEINNEPFKYENAIKIIAYDTYIDLYDKFYITTHIKKEHPKFIKIIEKIIKEKNLKTKLYFIPESIKPKPY